MAKKITAIVCGVSWAAFVIGLLLALRNPVENLALGIIMQLGLVVGIGSGIALAILALIDYARRPR